MAHILQQCCESMWCDRPAGVCSRWRDWCVPVVCHNSRPSLTRPVSSHSLFDDLFLFYLLRRLRFFLHSSSSGSDHRYCYRTISVAISVTAKSSAECLKFRSDIQVGSSDSNWLTRFNGPHQLQIDGWLVDGLMWYLLACMVVVAEVFSHDFIGVVNF